MAEYIDKAPFLDKLLYMGYFDDNNEIKEVADSFTTENVVERSKIDKAIEEITNEFINNPCVHFYGDAEEPTAEACIEILKRNIGE